MNAAAPLFRDDAVASGQAQRTAGMTRDAALHEQLYRYAEDLQQMVERNSGLEAHSAALRESCERLTESRSLLDNLVFSSRDIHIVTDSFGTVLHANPAVGVIAPSRQLAGRKLSDWVLPESRDAYQKLRTQAAGEAHDDAEWELRLRRAQPGEEIVIVIARVIPVGHGEGTQLHWILRDITRLREIQFESRISSMVFKGATEGVMITDVAGVILAVNPAFTKITGYAAEEVIGQKSSLLKSGLQDDAFYADFWRAIRDNGYWQGEIYNRKKSGETYPEWLNVNAARDADGKVLSYIAVFSDLSRLLQTEKRLSYLAHHDTLTDLPNRLLFQDRLAQTLTQARRSGVPFTVIFIDLDRFKQINDSFGHEIGDRVLQEAARRLTSVVRDADTVARLGGDEFVLLAPGLSGAEDIGQLCAKALDALVRPMLVDGLELYIGGSFGCAEYPLHGEDESTLLNHADVAMYRAKAAGGNLHCIFEQNEAAGGGALRMETELRWAIDRQQLRLEYQPQVAADDGRLIGVEALLRWDHPQLGLVLPADFVPVAEQLGLIVRIGTWVLDTACGQMDAWDRAGIQVPSMAVNISPRQMRDPDFVSVVGDALARHAIDPGRLELEVTESEVMFHADADASKLSLLRKLGVRIAIDDFGTGYSSLARLRALPINRIKIDRSFVAALEEDDQALAAAISTAIVTMGRALGIHLLAEGVESANQYDILSRQGCHAMQGDLTGRPIRPEQFGDWLAALQVRPQTRETATCAS